MNSNKLKMSCNGGFTLIELLVVVLIIGILAAVAMPQYQKAVAKSRMATLKSLVQTVSNAAEVYYLANDKYPTSFDELDIDIPTPDEIKNNTSYVQANYPWGNCVLQVNTSESLCKCANTMVGLTYIQRFIHAPNHAGKRSCKAFNQIAESVCIQETGNSTPYNTTDGKSYFY